jgi:alcohol dehydrogenase
MKFYMPVKLYQEVNCVRNHASEIVSLGTRAILVTGGSSSKKNGSLSDVEGVLDDSGIPFTLFDGVEQNPSTDTVMKIRDQALTFGADLCIGIGGGSSLDAAKAAALMIKNSDKGIDYLYEKGNPVDTIPVIEVPTTCGTGSEVTAVSVLTNHKTNTKGSIPYKIFPVLGLADPRYLKSLPLSVLRNTAVDALAHLWESLINVHSDAYSDMTAEAGLKAWALNRDILLGIRQASDDDFSNFMTASVMGGMSIAQVGTTIPHGLSYALTLNADIPHGKACGFFEAGYLSHADKELRNRALSLADFKDLDDWREFYAEVSDHLTVSEDILRKAVDELQESKMALAPFPCDKKILDEIARNLSR